MSYRTGLLPLCLRARSRTQQQPITVLFQNSAFMVEKHRCAKKQK